MNFDRNLKRFKFIYSQTNKKNSKLTDENKIFLVDNSKKYTIKELTQLLPNCSKNCIRCFLYDNNLKYKKVLRNLNKFTNEEKQFLQDHSKEFTLDELYQKLKNNHSKVQIYSYLSYCKLSFMIIKKKK